MKPHLILLAALALSACAAKTAVLDPTVGGAQMYPSKTMLANLSASNDHNKLVAAAAAGGIAGDLSGRGPLTFFAPTDAAFDALPDHDAVMHDKARLSHIMDCSLVAGITSEAQLQQLIVDHNGRYRLDTLGGCPLTATIAADGGLILTSDSGSVAHVTVPDIKQENGVVHVIDAVLIP